MTYLLLLNFRNVYELFANRITVCLHSTRLVDVVYVLFSKGAGYDNDVGSTGVMRAMDADNVRIP